MYFFKAAAFLKFSVFERVISLQQSFFSEYLIFRNKIFVKTGSSFGQLLLGTATFLWTICLEQRYPLKSSSDRSRYICAASAFLEEPKFWKTHFSWRATFLQQPLFPKTLLSIAATLSEELLSHSILFQKSCYFTAKLSFLFTAKATIYQIVIK